MGETSHSRRAAIYTRISKDPEGKEIGVKRQEADCRELASRLNLDVVAVYSDNDTGASDRTHKAKVRHEYAAMLEDARRRQFDTILTYSNSRLTRRMMELEGLITLTEETGVTIKTVVSGQYDLTTAAGKTIARILASVDAGESENISERQRASFRSKAVKGIPKLQHQRPFGWQADGLTLEQNEANLVRTAVQRIIAGASITAIAREWEEQGVLTAAGKTKWEWTPLKKVLLGWRTAGVRTYQREPLRGTDGQYVRGTWTPIITLEERDAALAMLGNRSLRKQRHGNWLLAGLVRCAECPQMMYGSLGDGKRSVNTYACKNGQHVVITAERLEHYVESAVISRVTRRAQEAAERQGFGHSAKATTWDGEARLARVTQQIGEVNEAHRADLISTNVWISQVDSLTREQELLVKQKAVFDAAHAPARLPFVRSEDVGGWVAENTFYLSFEGKAALFRRELEWVTVRKGVRGRRLKNLQAIEERVSLHWREDVPVSPAPDYDKLAELRKPYTDAEWAEYSQSENSDTKLP